MKKLLLLTILVTASAHADWPFHRVKKAVPLTAADKAALAEDAKQKAEKEKHAAEYLAKMSQIKQDLLKHNPGREGTLLSGRLALSDADLIALWEADKFDDEIKAINRAIYVAHSTEQLKGTISRLNAITPSEGTTYARLERNEILQTKMMANARADELKKSEAAAYCLAHYKTATTPEEIEASLPHYSWYAMKEMSDMNFERNMGMTKEAFDEDFKKSLLSMSREQRITAIDNMFSIDARIKARLESDPGYQQLKAKEVRSEQMAMQSEMVLNSSKQVEAAREANMNAAEANSIAQKAAMQQHWDSQEAISRQHLDSLQQESLNSYHSGTIQFDNGRSATYQGN